MHLLFLIRHLLSILPTREKVKHRAFKCVGLEINANHIRSAREGKVTGTATPLHLGGSTHVWEIKIHDEQQKLICVSRITVAVIGKKS